jgi:hypothetical protein
MEWYEVRGTPRIIETRGRRLDETEFLANVPTFTFADCASGLAWPIFVWLCAFWHAIEDSSARMYRQALAG